MWKWLGTVTVLTIAMTIQACAPKSQEDCGFVQNVYGERISWKRDVPVQMFLHADIPDYMVPVILDAARTWEETAGRQIININTSSRVQGPATPQKDGKNVIYLMQEWETNRTSEQGRTSVYWVGDLIKEADIRLNAADFSFYANGRQLSQAQRRAGAPQVNLEALVLHEMGHVLGLKHKDNDGSVMATYLQANDDRTALAFSDSANLKCEY